MKNYILLIVFTITLNINAQQSNAAIKKDSLGISVNAPKGVQQYAFRIGEWETTYKSLISRYNWKTGVGKHKVYMADNGLTFIEESLDKDGNIIIKTTYDYIEKTDSWNNNYLEVSTGKMINYTAKLIDGKMVETVKHEKEQAIDDITYTVLQNNIFLYISRRTYGNGFNLVTHVEIATKKQSK